MGANRQLAAWLIARRQTIDAALAAELGPALPGPASPEAEALRRFRSFAAATLLRGTGAPPSLEGLRVHEQRATRLLDGWVAAAARVAGPDAEIVSTSLRPLRESFQTALRTTAPARRARGAPRPGRRRVVSAAIDRIADVFLAVDADAGTIEDANPAAGALLGAARDELLGEPALRFVPAAARDTWLLELDAVAEGAEARRFRSVLLDVGGGEVAVEASVTRFSTRKRTLALFMARPVGA